MTKCMKAHFFLTSSLMISFIFYRRPPPLKSVTMATRKALFPIFKFQKFTNTYFGKVTKFQLNCFNRLGAAFKKPEGGGIAPSLPPPVRLALSVVFRISSMAMLSMFIGLLVCIPLGAVSLAGVKASGVAMELAKKYQKNLGSHKIG